MPRDSTPLDTRRTATVALTSYATLALVPLLGHAKPSERVLLLLAAVPVAALFGYLAGYAAASSSLPDAAHLQAARLIHTTAVPAPQPEAAVLTLITEPVEGPPFRSARRGPGPVPPPATAGVPVPGAGDVDRRRGRGIDLDGSAHLTR